MKKITPHLWFDNNAKEAAEFYVSAFGRGSKILFVNTLHDTPSGDCDVVSFELCGQSFQAISAGPLFKFNPSISFILNFDPSEDKNAEENLNALWKQLSGEGSKILLEVKEYPFSKRYGWVQDKFGVSWQLILSKPEGEKRPFVVPTLLFVGPMCGKAEEATAFYRSIFKNSRDGSISRYGKDMEPNKEGTVSFCDFMLEGQWFAAMDSAKQHDFIFNEAISLEVFCEDQKEMDHYWKLLSAVPESEQCGWIKDKYGVSWQIVPNAMNDMMKNGTVEQIDSMTQVLMPMKKIDLAAMQSAFEHPQASTKTGMKRTAPDEKESKITKKHKSDKGTDELHQAIGAQEVNK